jgi:general secretion pathway protein D
MNPLNTHLGTALLMFAGLAACVAQDPKTATARKPSRSATPATTMIGQPDEGAGNNSAKLFPGNGQLLAPKAEVPVSVRSGEGFRLDFVDTELSAVAAAVLGDGLNVPYVIDPQVKGNISLQASRPLSAEEMLMAFETALRAQGVVLVRQGDVYQLLPAKDGPRRIGRLQREVSGQGYGVHVISLQYVGAEEMSKILQPFAPDGGILRVDEARNLLLVAGSAVEIATLKEVIGTFDVDWLAGMSFALFPVEYVDVKTLATELSEIFEKAGSPITGVVRLIPLARLNSMMVVTPQARYLRDVETWIRRLDIGATTPGRRIYVYDVQNGKADDLARSLGRILSISTESSSNSSSTSGGSLGASAGSDSISSGSGNVLNPGNRSAALNPGGSGESSGSLDSGTLKIVPNSENNSLLILATPSEFQVIESALHRLDVLPIQVMIEASIAEVTLTDDIKYGLQWAYQGPNGPITLSEAGSGTINSQFPGFSYLYTGRQGIRAVLNAIESLTNVRVLSAPKLMVLNNREAQLQVGDQVPISVQSAVGTADANSPIVNAIQLRDTGVILRVTPRANKSGRVVLEVAQEVSDAAPNKVSGIDSPSITQRKISTTVSVQDGETVALGGLIRDTQSGGGSGIPFLRKIPLLGQLFGSTSRNGRRTELIVLITPRVLRSEDETAAAMEDLREQFRGLRKLVPEWRAPARGATEDQVITPNP